MTLLRPGYDTRAVPLSSLVKALGFPDARHLFQAELPEIDADLLLNTASVASTGSSAEVALFGFERMLVLARLVLETGFVRPAEDHEQDRQHHHDTDGQRLAHRRLRWRRRTVLGRLRSALAPPRL